MNSLGRALCHRLFNEGRFAKMVWERTKNEHITCDMPLKMKITSHNVKKKL